MKKETAIKLFESKQVRTAWSEDEDKWYFSIVDVIAVLTDSPNANNYWKVLKHRLSKEGSELVTNCNQLNVIVTSKLKTQSPNILIGSYGHLDGLARYCQLT